MSASAPLFRFAQIELPWPLGPPDGRYLVRSAGDPEGPPTHVIVLKTLGALQRGRLATLRKQRDAPRAPDPTPVATTRATVIDVGAPLNNSDQAEAWLSQAAEPELGAGLATLNRTLRAFRLVSADPFLNPITRGQALVARIGFGAGEQVADGQWLRAKELIWSGERRRRTRVLVAQARLAAVLGARERLLVCEELTLRARLDLEQGYDREAALQLRVALETALAELESEWAGAAMAARLDELRAQLGPVSAAGYSASQGQLSPDQLRTVEFALGRLEAALRARAARGA